MPYVSSSYSSRIGCMACTHLQTTRMISFCWLSLVAIFMRIGLVVRFILENVKNQFVMSYPTIGNVAVIYAVKAVIAIDGVIG